MQNRVEVILFMLMIHGTIFYTNYYIILPKTFAQQRYLIFALVAVSFFALMYTFTYQVFSYAYANDIWFHPEELRSLALDNRVTRHPEMLWTARFGMGGMNIFFISIIAFVANQDNIKKQQLWELEREKISAEIKLLRMQINPHFLFNSLNNIYSKAVLEESEVADSIHKLSGLLRYTLYDCDTDRIAITKELDYLDNYIDLQGLRGDVLDQVELTVEGDILKASIAPMLLISFVENAFKHGNIGEGGWIKINISAKPKELLFTCSNSIGTVPKNKDKASGIGLVNVQKRLELYYPNNHELVIDNQKDIFEIKLRIFYDH